MFNADTLTFREFRMNESLPLATIHSSVLEFLCDRDDVVLFGAQAVNAYVDEPRMTQDIDLLSNDAARLAEDLCTYLGLKFHIAVRIRQVAQGQGFRLYQLQKSGNRHLIDIRSVETLPPAERIAQILVVSPPELIANKVIAFYQRRGQPKSGTDWRDITMLLLAFPELKHDSGPVAERLLAAGASPEIMDTWHTFVAQEVIPAQEDDEFSS